MPQRFLSYEPQPVFIPDDAGVERTFEGHALSAEQLALCDRRTIFCDMFLSADRSELLCIGPPFANLGRPEAVLVGGARRKFSVGMPQSRKIVDMVRIRLSEADAAGSTFELRFVFQDFEVHALATPRPLALPPVSLMLATTQKDNDPHWVADWCAWHQRAHGVERVVIYDNGSADVEDVYSRARRLPGLDLVRVTWDFPFGPPHPSSLNFTQAIALNHCRLTFGTRARWCINLDLDEYLYNQGGLPVEGILERSGAPVRYLTSLIVPMTVDNTPRRCFDSSIRFRSAEQDGRKYIYRPERVAFAAIHWVALRSRRLSPRLLHQQARELLRVSGLSKVLRLRGMQRTLLRCIGKLRGREHEPDAPGGGQGSLFFFHFRALNTGWKYKRRIVDVKPADVVSDPRIAGMKEVIEAER